MADSKRIPWVDTAKGIAILLVIAGHTVNNSIIRGMIFSFHMPLFFILSGYTSSCSSSWEQLLSRLKKTARALLLPAYILWFAGLIYIAGFHYSPLQIALGLLATHIKDMDVPDFGYMWFLTALFVVRNLYDLINYITKGRFMTIISLIITMTGIIIGKYLCLPLSADAAMASVIFYHFGQILRKREIHASVLKAFIAVLLWGSLFFILHIKTNSYLDINERVYQIVPLSFPAAIAGSLAYIFFCMYLCKLDKNKIVTDKLCFIGQNSIILLSIHYMDDIWFLYITYLIDNSCLTLWIRLIGDIVLLYIIIKGRSIIKKHLEIS